LPNNVDVPVARRGEHGASSIQRDTVCIRTCGNGKAVSTLRLGFSVPLSRKRLAFSIQALKIDISKRIVLPYTDPSACTNGKPTVPQEDLDHVSAAYTAATA
jgi:hypothetical protein